MKTILKVSLLVLGVALYSCGGGQSSDSESQDEPISNSGSDSTAMAPSPSSTSSVDVNAKSDSKGVGKFTDVKIAGKLDPKLAKEGQDLFQTKCSVCHKPTDEKLIGPGLKGITTIRTPEWIMNMMTNPTGMTQSDPIAKALLNEFQTQMTFQSVTDENARAIYEFLRQNDGVK